MINLIALNYVLSYIESLTHELAMATANKLYESPRYLTLYRADVMAAREQLAKPVVKPHSWELDRLDMMAFWDGCNDADKIWNR